MSQRSSAVPGHLLPGAGGTPPGDGPQQAAVSGHIARRGDSTGPVIVLSYLYSGADRVQDALAADTGLACTSGTGIIPMCAAAAETWRRIEGHHGAAISRLAAASIRGIVGAQMAVILAGAGRTRWCELANASPSAVEPFLQVFPGTRIVCVHRSCLDVVRAGVRASPWGLHGQGLLSYLVSYSGNSAAALATYWVNSTEQLLAFEQANRDTTHSVRYEDVAADPDQALSAIRTALQLGRPEPDGPIGEPRDNPGPDGTPVTPQAEVPAQLIPERLRQHIDQLHAQLGYPPPYG